MAAGKKTGWEHKPRTMLRSIKPGDVFAFVFDERKFGLGRILAKNSLGHAAEFFEIFLDQPDLSGVDVESLRRLGTPVVLDSYGLFDRKIEGDWRIIAHDEDFVPQDVDGVFFKYGSINDQRRVDMSGAGALRISDLEARKYPDYSPMGDKDVKRNVYAS